MDRLDQIIIMGSWPKPLVRSKKVFVVPCGSDVSRISKIHGIGMQEGARKFQKEVWACPRLPFPFG